MKSRVTIFFFFTTLLIKFNILQIMPQNLVPNSSLEPQIEFNSCYLDSIKSWITLQSFYSAEGFEKYLMIGNFKTDKNTTTRKIRPIVEKRKKRKWDLSSGEKATYYYIDDVIIEKAEITDRLAFIVPDKKGLTDTFNIEEIDLDTSLDHMNFIWELTCLFCNFKSILSLKI